MNRTDLIDTLQATHQVLTTNGFDVAPLVIEPIATEAQVTAIESTLGRSLPAPYRNVLLTVSRRVEFSWFTPDDPMFPDPFEDNISGDLHWSLDRTIDLIAEANAARDGLVLLEDRRPPRCPTGHRSVKGFARSVVYLVMHHPQEVPPRDQDWSAPRRQTQPRRSRLGSGQRYSIGAFSTFLLSRCSEQSLPEPTPLPDLDALLIDAGRVLDTLTPLAESARRRKSGEVGFES